MKIRRILQLIKMVTRHTCHRDNVRETLLAEKDELKDKVVAEKQTRGESGLAAEIQELQAETDTGDKGLEVKSTRV